MRTSKVKSYFYIADTEGAEAAQKQVDTDGDYIDENFPHLTRSFQVVHHRIDNMEALLESVKTSLLQINASLQVIHSLTGDDHHEKKH